MTSPAGLRSSAQRAQARAGARRAAPGRSARLTGVAARQRLRSIQCAQGLRDEAGAVRLQLGPAVARRVPEQAAEQRGLTAGSGAQIERVPAVMATRVERLPGLSAPIGSPRPAHRPALTDRRDGTGIASGRLRRTATAAGESHPAAKARPAGPAGRATKDTCRRLIVGGERGSGVSAASPLAHRERGYDPARVACVMARSRSGRCPPMARARPASRRVGERDPAQHGIDETGPALADAARAGSTVADTAAWVGTRVRSSWWVPRRSTSSTGGSTSSSGRSTTACSTASYVPRKRSVP